MNKFLIMAAIGFALSTSANANITYTYSGNQVIGHDYGAHIGESLSPINATLEFSDDGTNLIDFTISQTEFGTLTMADIFNQYANGNNFSQRFDFNTNSLGEVTGWRINVQKIFGDHEPGDPHFTSFDINDNATAKLYGFNDGFTYFQGLGDPNTFAFNNTPGTWVSSNPHANIDYHHVFTPPPVPEPSTYLMLLLGLGMIGFVGRGKFN